MNRRGEATERFNERRRKEDEAPRLRDVAPDLVSCRIEIAERRPGVTSTDVTHTRHVIVAHAPALLVIPCSDPNCKEGGHDVTTILLRGFREHSTAIRGEHTCDGDIKTVHCGRVLTFTATAVYRQP
jgi:hypothetical protein